MLEVSWIDGRTGECVDVYVKTMKVAHELAVTMSQGADASISTEGVFLKYEDAECVRFEFGRVLVNMRSGEITVDDGVLAVDTLKKINTIIEGIEE